MEEKQEEIKEEIIEEKNEEPEEANMSELYIPTNLEGFVNTKTEVRETEEGKTSYWLYGYLQECPEDRLCPKCGSRMVIVDHRDITYNHMPIFEKETIISVNRNRYRCNNCNKKYAQTVPFAADAKYRITKDLETMILKLLSAFQYTYRQIAIMTSTNISIVQAVKDKYAKEIEEGKSNIIAWNKKITVTICSDDDKEE